MTHPSDAASTNAFERAITQFFETKCSPGAASSAFYTAIFYDAWRAALDAVAARLPVPGRFTVEHVLLALQRDAVTYTEAWLERSKPTDALHGLPLGHLISAIADEQGGRPISEEDTAALEQWRDDARRRGAKPYICGVCCTWALESDMVRVVHEGMHAPTYYCADCASKNIKESLAREQEATTDPEVERLRAAIRKHRDEKGDDRCWLDDVELYKALPEGVADADLRLHEPEVMLANCKRFIAHRHDPSVPYASPQRRIEELEAEVKRLTTATDEFDGLLVVRAIGESAVLAQWPVRVKQLAPGRVEFLRVGERYTLEEDWMGSAIYLQLPNGFSIHLWDLEPLKRGDSIGLDGVV